MLEAEQKEQGDVDGDGQYDDKEFTVQARQFYNSPKPDGSKSGGGDK